MLRVRDAPENVEIWAWRPSASLSSLRASRGALLAVAALFVVSHHTPQHVIIPERTFPIFVPLAHLIEEVLA